MNIALVQIENLLGITEAKLEPGKVTLIEGKNGAGKSATIDAIIAAFNAKGIEGELVTQGAEKGRVYIKLDDGTSITRTINKQGKTTSLTVKDSNGFAPPNPQGYLDKLFGAQVVNPISFINMTTAEKRKVLLSALDIKVSQDDLQGWFGKTLPVDTDQHGLVVLEQAAKLLYEERKQANSEVKGLKNELEVVAKDIPVGFDAAEWENVDTGSLTIRLQDIGRIEAEKRQKLAEADRVLKQGKEWQAKSQSLLNDAASVEREIDRMKKRQDELKDEAAQLSDNGAAEISAADALKEEAEAIVVPDKSDIEQKLADYSSAQRIIQQVNNKTRLEADIELAEANAATLDELLEVARQKPKDLLAQAEFPIEGLAFDGDEITINGLSIDSLSDGEKLNLGVAIAKSGTGPLGFIVIDGAELLDPENLQKLLDMAKADTEHHYVITRVTGGELTVRNAVEEVDERQTSLFDEENQ